MKYYCAMDVGGTSARLQIRDISDSLLGEFVGKGCTINVDGNDVCEKRYRDIVLTSLDKLQLKPENCIGACIAASGIDTKENEIDCKNFFVNMGFNSEYVEACNDCEVFLLSSDEPDIIVISGTGSIVTGRTKNGFVRCGGWGHIISDEGSAYAMAVKIFRAVSRHLDGRQSCSILTDMLMSENGFTSPVDLNEYLANNMVDRTRIACYAKLAETAAQKGDMGAQKILEECANDLFELVCDTYKKIKNDVSGEITVWLWGSVISSPDRPVAVLLKKKIENSKMRMRVQFPECKALDAAMCAAKRIS